MPAPSRWLVIWLLWGVAAHAANPQAVTTVERFQAALIGAMKEGGNLGFAGRRDRLEDTVRETFDLAFVSRLVMTDHWSVLDDRQRAMFEERFTRMAMATLAARFDSYSGEVFQVMSSRPTETDRVRVRSEFRFPEGEVVVIDYALHNRAGAWRIINVWFDGVSGAQIQRDEFSAIMESEGFESLLRQIEDRIIHYEGGGT